MHNRTTFLLALITSLTISACNITAYQKPAISPVEPIKSETLLQSVGVTSVIATDIEALWSRKFDHYQKGLLLDVSEAIIVLAQQGDLSDNDLDKLSFYLRVYSSFGPDEDWPKGTAQSLNNALLALQNMPDFYQITATTARLHENYAVALYRFYFLPQMQLHSAAHIKPLTKLINLYASNKFTTALEDNSPDVEYALWEVIRASAILPYEATRKNEAAHLVIYSQATQLSEALLNFIKSENAVVSGNDWPRQHAVWALSQYYNVFNKQYLNAYYKKSEAEQKLLDDKKSILPAQQKMADLDNALWQTLVNSVENIDETEYKLKKLFSVPYVVSTYRGKSECEEGSLKDRCIEPSVEEATPIKHVCSESLFIRTQKMTKRQLENSCQKLLLQERVFHEKLATKHEPVANDFNDKLRVVVFENAAEYNKYGQLTFDISTNNGGMYIEGTTQDPENQATFYSYEHFWVRPKFQVWNLQHEYVHYLDGRFNKYDTFNHFPSHLVWWSEGLAEYIAQGEYNPKAMKHLRKTEQSEWLTLQQVFDTKYRDGTDQVYKWGYLAVRFMYERHEDEYRQLAHYLKTDFFDGYKKLLDDSGKSYQAEFNDWLFSLNKGFVDVVTESNLHKPRQFYRYTYKDYLQPAHLIETPRHMHWQYWHENALQETKNIAKQ